MSHTQEKTSQVVEKDAGGGIEKPENAQPKGR
jgi:hypothetical protein